MTRAQAAFTALVVSFLSCSATAVYSQSTPAPAPVSTTSPPPVIGRIRATVPSCAVLRQAIVPAWESARKVDALFEHNARPILPKYIAEVDDYYVPEPDKLISMQLSYLDEQVTTMKQSLLSIDRALHDKRLSNASDSTTELLRDKLQAVYYAQSYRTDTLREFVTRQRAEQARKENTAMRQGTNRNNRFNLHFFVPPTPDPYQTPSRYGMPAFNGVAERDAQVMTEWTQSIDHAVAQIEFSSVETFAAVENACK